MRWKDGLVTANGFIQNLRWNKLKKIPLRHFLFYALLFSKLRNHVTNFRVAALHNTVAFRLSGLLLTAMAALQ